MTQDITKSIEACAAHYGNDAQAMRDYLIDGQQRALELDNRGPLKFDNNGHLDPAIRAAYSKYGFYVFEKLINDDELTNIKADLTAMRAGFPVDSASNVDINGNKAINADNKGPSLIWAKPLADPFGGTPLANGRHQVKLFEPKADAEAPDFAPFILLGHLQFSDACLRIYGHPQLLRVASEIHGQDFTPFNESLFMKEPGLGAAVSWHQDGDTHWDSPDFDEDSHGFNFMVKVFGSTAVNGVWVVPGTHKTGRVDIKKMVADAGSERLPDAVPMICEPGDVVICNRQALHGSFANTGYEPRISINFGFLRRSSVLNVTGAGIHTTAAVYDENRIKERSKVIGLAIDARHQHYPDETPFDYEPLSKENITWTPEAKQCLRDYNILDLSI